MRPSYTLGGSGGGVAFNAADLRRIAENGLKQSPVHEVLIEMSVLGWKEYELEVMRDVKGNFVVVCTIENLDPMGVHTGDSITVAPAQTLTDKELQRLRDMAKAVLDRIGLATGGANVQFAINPADGQVYVIEMNPRVSRSSALASKATGFPIAKIAALLAVGFTLDEIPNDITRVTPASFEPSLDYVVVKIPRWDFAKFPGADSTLGPQMKAIGEVMAIGRTFPEALQKGIRALDIGVDGFGSKLLEATPDMLRVPTAQRIFQVAWALHEGVSPEEIVETTHFDPWFVRQLVDIMAIRDKMADKGLTLEPPRRRRLAQAQALRLRRCASGASAQHRRDERPQCPQSRWASCRATTASIPARRSSKPSRPTCTRPTRKTTKPSRPTRKKS